MTRRTYIWDADTREFIEIEKRRPGPRGQIIEDTMPLTWHPCDGQHYDSKSQFRRVTRAHGGLETGGESQKHVEKNRPQLSREDRKQDIARAIRRLKGLE